MINTCTVQRDTPGAADAYGNPAEVWGNHLVDEPCRIMAGVSGGNLNAGREFKVGAEVVQAEYMLYIGDVDITEQDRVVLGGVTYHILLVDERQNGTAVHHKEVWLRAVR